MDALALPGCQPSRAAWWGRPPCPQPRAQLFVTQPCDSEQHEFWRPRCHFVTFKEFILFVP